MFESDVKIWKSTIDKLNHLTPACRQVSLVYWNYGEGSNLAFLFVGSAIATEENYAELQEKGIIDPYGGYDEES